VSGVLWRQDTFYVGSLKGVGRIYQQTFIDTYSKLGFAKLYDRKTPITAAAVCQVKSWLIHFNHTLSVEINTNDSIAALRSLRASLRDQRSRALLSHLEGVFRQYLAIEFDAIRPNTSLSRELITIFDRLVNYLPYSESIARLRMPKTRQQALADLREYSLRTVSPTWVRSGWD